MWKPEINSRTYRCNFFPLTPLSIPHKQWAFQSTIIIIITIIIIFIIIFIPLNWTASLPSLTSDKKLSKTISCKTEGRAEDAKEGSPAVQPSSDWFSTSVWNDKPGKIKLQKAGPCQNT